MTRWIEYQAQGVVYVRHRPPDEPAGPVHGHTLVVRAIRTEPCDLMWWRGQVQAAVKGIGSGALEDGPVKGRTFEEVGAYLLRTLPYCTRVLIEVSGEDVQLEVAR